MRTIGILLAGTAALATALPASAMTAEEVVAKHIAARGGREAWNEIQSMKITGQYTAFSKVSPFTLHRQRANLFHMDHVLDDKRVIIGHDGESAWWDNPWRQAGVQKVGPGPDMEALQRRFDFVPPLFDYAERGFDVKLIGETEFEGIPVIGLEVIRGEDSRETWYLDPDTYLEVARESPGSDFGQPMPQRTYFDDFRQVGKVTLPFMTESQWYTRDRILQIEDVQINVDLDEAMFEMPAPKGMAMFQNMAGKWKVALQSRQQPGADWNDSERESEIELLMGGALVQESFSVGQTDLLRTISFDQFGDRYRLTEIDSQRNQMDIQEGELADGRLEVSNADTGTTWNGFGMTFHTKTAVFDVSDDSFQVERAISIDGGESWFVNAKATYTRAE